LEGSAVPLEPEYLVGVDLGQRHDYTAICVAERRAVRADGESPEGHGHRPTGPGLARFAGGVGSYDIVHLERQRGEPYTALPGRLHDLLRAIAAAHEERHRRPAKTTLVVDQTGVGVAVVDVLRAAGLDPVAVTITGGDATSRGADRSYRVPKRELVGAVQVLLQGRRLRVAAELAHAPTLVAEFQNFKATISLTGHDSYGAGSDWREGHHDDLVLAVAMAAWFGESVRVPVASVGSYFATGPPERGPFTTR